MVFVQPMLCANADFDYRALDQMVWPEYDAFLRGPYFFACQANLKSQINMVDEAVNVDAFFQSLKSIFIDDDDYDGLDVLEYDSRAQLDQQGTVWFCIEFITNRQLVRFKLSATQVPRLKLAYISNMRIHKYLTHRWYAPEGTNILSS